MLRDANLRGALKDIYPVTLAIVGESFFLRAADEFIRETPSRAGDLNRFGREWAAFLGAYPHAQELPYLADVARLEWAWHEAFHAADAAAFDLARLGEIPPENHGSLRFSLHPAVRFVDSKFPILRIREVNQPGYAGELAVNWDVRAESLIVRRDIDDGMSVQVERIGATESLFLQALQRGETLESAADVAFAADPAFDLQARLLEAVRSGVISDVQSG
ncbi:MAG: DNA-binding domain-containing protein [Usitatibacteraceae bacterium]